MYKITNNPSTEFMCDMVEEISIKSYTRSSKKIAINKNDETQKQTKKSKDRLCKVGR